MIFLKHLLQSTNGVLYYQGKQTRFDAFSHDTRQLIPGELFVAVRGERSDGHDYIVEAIRRGATALLVEARYFNGLAQDMVATIEQAQCATIVVEDTRLALQQYAQYILALWHPTVIAVTGSVGKTSTKEAIATVLSSHFSTFRSWQNYNDLLGLPLSLGRLEQHHEYAVVELGCDHPGEIADLCRIVQPQYGVLTNINPVQLQYFGTVEHLATELGTLFTALPATGYAVFNQDDPHIQQLVSRRGEDTLHASPLPYSLALFLARDVQATWEGLRFTLPLLASNKRAEIGIVQLTTQLLGIHNVSTMLAAYTIARQCGMRPEEIKNVLAALHPLPGRLNPLEGIESAMLLDDTHNASPASVMAGLATLDKLSQGRRIAILGDMLHLGEYEQEAHQRVGRAAVWCVDYLITRGERAAMIAEAALAAGLPQEHVIVTSTHEDAAQAARYLLANRDVQDATGVINLAPTTGTVRAQFIAPPATDTLLIKGSEETRMERVTELLMARREQAREVLVRQTPGWKQIVMTRAERPTWVEVDLSAIGNNTRRIKDIVGPVVQVLVSLKADAYGHGAIKVARTVLHNGASMLGVATLSEATPLREAGITAPILVFGYVPLWQMREAVRQDVTVTLYSIEAAQALSRAALALGKMVKVHVKIDTGMGRLGIRTEQTEEIMRLVQDIAVLPGLIFEGLYTHFAMADAQDKQHAQLQLSRFESVLYLLTELGLRPPIVHAANSAATLDLVESRYDMVRPGIAIYGLDPSAEVRLPEGFRPALSFKTLVAQVKLVPADECISYGCTYTTERPTLVATLPVGYADGFRRAPRNWGSVLIHGQEAPILGRVCMDQCMVDVTHIPQVRMGDEVVLIGRQGNATLTAEQVAERLGTINYEVVSEILARVPRVD